MTMNLDQHWNTSIHELLIDLAFPDTHIIFQDGDVKINRILFGVLHPYLRDSLPFNSISNISMIMPHTKKADFEAEYLKIAEKEFIKEEAVEVCRVESFPLESHESVDNIDSFDNMCDAIIEHVEYALEKDKLEAVNEVDSYQLSSIDCDVEYPSSHESLTGFPCPFCQSVYSENPYLLKHLSNDHNYHVCQYCDYFAETKETLEDHVHIHFEGSQDKSVKECKECDYKTTHASNLHSHMNAIHLGKRFKCSYCDFTAKYKNNVKRHENGNHLNILFKCKYCDYTTKQSGTIKDHEGAMHEGKVLKCDKCNFESGFRQAIDRHMKDGIHDIQQPFEKRSYNLTARSRNRVQHKYNFKCGICNDIVHSTQWSVHKKLRHDSVDDIERVCSSCDYKTLYGHNLRGHMKKYHNQNLGKSIHTRHRQRKHKYNFKCGICNETVNSTEWSMHKKVKHSGLEDIEQGCEFCDYKTIYGQNFRLHVRNNHTENYILGCGECGEKMDNKNWRSHEINNHEGRFVERVCVSCDFKTAHGQSLQYHMKAIHGHPNGKNKTTTKRKVLKNKVIAKTIRCSNCSEKILARDWHKHLQQNHSDLNNENAKIQCSDCDFNTSSIFYIRDHLRAEHEKINYECDECDYKSKFSSSLSVHKKRKHREGPNISQQDNLSHDDPQLNKESRSVPRSLKCKECDKVFACTTNLTRHSYVHTGIKPFPCNYCDKAFSRKDKLRVHYMKVHVTPI